MMEKFLKENENAFYVFDVSILKKRLNYLREKLTCNVDLCYAVKANTFIIKEIINDVERFEICSPGEAEICKRLSVPDEKMVISGVYKTPSVMKKLVAESDGHIYTVESLNQFDLFVKLSEKYQKKLSVLLRLTNDSQFGINKNDIENIVSSRDKYKFIDFLGIQYFSGTQKTSVKKFARELSKLDQFLIELKENYSFEAKELEYGTGFPAEYFTCDEIDENEILKSFSELVDKMVSRPKITLELGRSIAASCGKYYTHIVDMKTNKNQNYVLIDGGMHQLVYFGQHMAMKQPFLSVVGKENAPKKMEWNICGSLCSMNDIVAKQVSLPDIETGDVICFENTGAYCITECISFFLSRDIPSVYIKNENGEFICVRRSSETLEFNTPDYERK